MTITYSNAKATSSSHVSGFAYVASAVVFLVFPAVIIAIGFFSSQPTGTLISPLPSTQISESPTPTVSNNLPIIANDKDEVVASSSAENLSNSISNQAAFSPGTIQVEVKDQRITANSQILLVPKAGDSSTYFVVSKDTGKFVIGTDKADSTERVIDYQIVNP